MADVQCCCSQIRIPQHVHKYKIIKRLGNGSFAVVVLGKDEKTGELVAIKILDRSQVMSNGILQYVENELRLASRFDHPNVVKVYDIIYEEDIIMIIMEYLPNGDLQTVLTNNTIFTYNEQVRITHGIINGLCYLHQRNVAHRDIKPENILFDAHFNPKLIDFGLSRETKSSLSTFCGTPCYLAPEIILDNKYNPFKSDVWALGLTIHILTNLCFPFRYEGEAEYLKSIKNKTLTIRNQSHGILGEIISMCLVEYPNRRASASQILDYIAKNDTGNFKISQSQVDKKLPVLTMPRLAARNYTPVVKVSSLKGSHVFKITRSPLRV
ncbi:CAMK family protein kinase [Trichomonas vaginalis G3]|uniref:CAMK family protein kinase n=1 Tax=Trichomonas vaginalis (strain ATCC PRA-98 / G3) TaxID=412133 RepID=A2FZR5_TRIV3|nr:protein serine/threonine kinase protein [Trichomonas vaginalis G3]EAX89605.1 CAMK family protein kinase [Trichomonas vaginalis G3]KAI5512107.1 protein serine/threonine kinase protein [Trichomonas vaginalis G3]|eukprot:XP_001302535.1 CAMK family protein kinase [Trichomonas vaginalis G3]